MRSQFGWPNLEACCDGKLNPEMLQRFQLAMREYEDFMSGMSALLAPKRDIPADDWRDYTCWFEVSGWRVD